MFEEGTGKRANAEIVAKRQMQSYRKAGRVLKKRTTRTAGMGERAIASGGGFKTEKWEKSW